MQTRKNAVLLAFMMILTSLLLLVSLSANITHAAEKGSTLNGQTQQFNKGEGNPNSKDSKSDSEKATPSKGTNSEDNSTTQSNQTATVTINKIASDTQKQLAGAHLQIWENGKLVQDFTTTGEASVFNLPKGEYTLKEVSAPEGYDVAEAQPFTVADENIATTIGTTVGAGTGKTGNKIYIDSGKEEIYIYGQNGRKDLGYCFNAQKHYPDRDDPDDPDDDKGVSYYKRSITDGSPVNQFMGTPRESKDEDSLKAIKTIIWNGFASNPDNVQKKYGLTDDELYRITQRAIWYYTDSGILDLGMPNDNLDRNVSDEVLQNALNDIIKVDPNSPIPSGMAIDFFTPDNTDYQNVLAASFTSTQTKAGKPVPVTLVDPKHEDTKPNKPVDTKPNKPVDTKPNKPVDTKPNKPVDTNPNKPVETKPKKPVDTKTNKHVDTKPNKHGETKQKK
ncbi:thioester-forming surface-anchored protein, partial [Lactobacillus gallinarum]|uniref:thioester-forming surface-anchored protein n=1 Tax=Lactobacillus gallinarum TaxID=52242 RepID=UPI0025A3FA63